MDRTEQLIQLYELEEGRMTSEQKIEIMGELQNAPQEQRPQEVLSELGEDLVKQLGREADYALSEGNRNLIGALLRARNLIKDERLPKWVQDRLRPKKIALQRELDGQSKASARSFIRRVEALLDAAEQNAANESLPAEKGLAAVRDQLGAAEHLLNGEIKPHLWHVGLKAVGQEMSPKMTAQQIIDGLKARADAVSKLIPQLKHRIQYEREHALEIAMERRLHEQQLQREAKERERQRAIDVLLRRCPRAREAVSRFFESLRLGDLNDAWLARNIVRRIDGGVPPFMEEAYERAAGASA